MPDALIAESVAGRQFSRIIHVANSVWALSPHDARAFGIARRRPRLSDARYDPPSDPGLGYGDFLRAVLDPRTAGDCWIQRSGSTGENHVGWIESRSDRVESLIDELTTDVHALWWRAWMWQLDDPASANSADDDPHGPRLEGMRHRIFISDERVKALWASELPATTGPIALNCSIVLDVRFFYRLRQLRCHVSTSLWSAPPRHPDHCPSGVRNDDETELAVEVEAYRAVFTALALRIRSLLGEFLHWSGFRVFGRPFGLPAFWIVVPSRDLVPSKPLKHLKPGQPAAQLVRLLLERDVRDRTVALGVVNGDLLVLRRMRRIREPAEPSGSTSLVVREVPSYLILPAGPEVADSAARPHVEIDTAKVITDLTDLEADAQHQLYELQADLQIWRNHLAVYNAVVERGSFLWDALSTHLPIQRDLKLARAHRAVELVHQMLLQAVADLGHIATLVSQGVANATDTAEALRDKYDQELSEWVVPSVNGLRPSLTQTGLVERVAEFGSDTLAEANRVKTAYDDQLRAIAHAFDERRARELDGIQKAQFTVGLGAGAIGLFTIADATVQMKYENEIGTLWGPDSIGAVAAIFSWCAAIVLILSVIYLVWRTRRIGRLGTEPFRELYQRGARRCRQGGSVSCVHGGGLRDFLAETSTDSLEQAADRDPSFADTSAWHDLDWRLTNWLCCLWDSGASLVPEGSERGHRDLTSLERQSELWGAHSLILTERVRRLHLYPLPNLTALYSCCMKTLNSFTHQLHRPEINAVAEVDFSRAMARLGFGPDEANAIRTWLTTRNYPSAAHALEHVGKLGLSVGMSSEDRKRTLRTVGHGQRGGYPVGENP